MVKTGGVTMPKNVKGTEGEGGLEPFREHLGAKMNRKNKRRTKHLHKKLNHKKGFRHGHGV